MVTPEAPVSAVKAAQVISATRARPPGIQPISARETRSSRWGLPLSAIRYPEKANNGMLIRIGMLAMRYISMITSEESSSTRAKLASALVAMTTKSGTPEMARMTTKMPRRMVMPCPPRRHHPSRSATRCVPLWRRGSENGWR